MIVSTAVHLALMLEAGVSMYLWGTSMYNVRQEQHRVEVCVGELQCAVSLNMLNTRVQKRWDEGYLKLMDGVACSAVTE